MKFKYFSLMLVVLLLSVGCGTSSDPVTGVPEGGECDSATECADGLSCGPAGLCFDAPTPVELGGACEQDLECASGLCGNEGVCIVFPLTGVPAGVPEGGQCDSNTECADGLSCGPAGLCFDAPTPVELGGACQQDLECASGWCGTDGACVE